MSSTQSVWLGLGSNLGDRFEYLQTAVNRLRDQRELELVQISPVYETSPWGVTGQNHYLNAVLHVTTTLVPQNILLLTQQIEREAGRRIRTERWAEREIDIDLLVFGDLQVYSSDFTLPHPRLHLRRFVLRPFADIARDLMIPGLGLSVGAALAVCKDDSEVKLYHKALDL